MFIKKIACIAALSTSAIASFTYAGSAHAINISYTPGVFKTPGVTDQGAFAQNVNDPNYVTIDFNNADSSFNGNKLVNYSFSGGTPSTTVNGQTGIISDQWAPAGVTGQNNNSKYLAVFSNSSVDITAKNGGVFNYFGLDAGALSDGNTFELLKAGKTVAVWTYDQLNNLATVANAGQGGQKMASLSFLPKVIATTLTQLGFLKLQVVVLKVITTHSKLLAEGTILSLCLNLLLLLV